MKKLFLPLAIAGLLLNSCAEAPADNAQTTESKTTEEHIAEDMAEGDEGALEDDLVSSIVHKGGAKSEDQIMIENMMADVDPANTGMDQEIIGHWVGSFGKNMINLTITSVAGDHIEGFSICAGNFRKITGTYTADENFVDVKMEEPGTNQYDGTFEFTVDLNKEEISGHWEPFKSEGNSAKDYVLKKRTFEYDVNVGNYDGSSELLTDDYLMELDEWTLGYIRNEIYARHGYSFKNKGWRYEFEVEPWYMPMGVDIREMLTDLEIQNIGLIYEYESYYDDYYDEYGR
jgi:hypothetical protein